MAKKTTFNNPDSQEREYTRSLLRYSKQLQADVNSVLLPRLPGLKAEYDIDARTDSWVDTLDALIAELARLAFDAMGSVVTKLPGMFSAVSKFNEGQFKLVVRANTGLPLPDVMPGAPTSAVLGVSVFRSEPYLKPLAEGWVSENTALIKSLPTRLHPELEGIVRRGVMNGQSVKDIKDQIKARYGVTDYRAKLIAQDQTLKLNADLTRYRLQSVGVERYVWRSVQDSRVRPEHADRNGKTYSWDKGPSNGQHPGQEVRCRCRAEAVWDDKENAETVSAERVHTAKQEARDAAYKVSLGGPGKEVFVRKILPLQEENLPSKANFDVFSKAQGVNANMSISSLTAIQDRVDLQKVNDYIEALAKGDKFPPVKVVRSGDKIFLLDGHHRVVASKLLGIKNISVEDIT